MINKHKSNKIKENSNTVKHLNNGTDHRHSKSCCDQSSPARRTMTGPYHSRGRISSSSAISVARNERRGKYIYMFQIYLTWSVDIPLPVSHISSIVYLLTHWGRDKMDAISQTTFSSAFSWMKMHEFRLIFHWSLFPRFELTIFQHWFR